MKEIFCLVTHSTHFYLRLYGVDEIQEVHDLLECTRWSNTSNFGTHSLYHGYFTLNPYSSNRYQSAKKAWVSVKEAKTSYWQLSQCLPLRHTNKGRGMCYSVCGMVHIKEPLLLIGKSSLCGGSGFPFSLSEWSLTICLTPYNRK